MTKFKPKITEKRWRVENELKLLELWEKEQLYRFNEEDEREVIAIDTPPPYASGKWHVGGAAHYAQIDMVARYFRMRNYNVLIPFYADRNGLPVEVQVEKATGLNPHEITKTVEGREHFLNLCREYLDKTEHELVKIWRRLGCSFEYWHDGTDSHEYRKITQATFIELWRRGLIYIAERPVNWCPRCRTTLADAELEYREEDTKLYYIVFKVKETGDDIVIATTRPELLNACQAVIYNPNDERYKHLAGKHAIIPLYEREVPILQHPAADPSFGTGLVMICSYGDTTDIRLFRELKLKPRVLITREGIMNEQAGPIKGLSIREARKTIANLLRERGLLKQEKVIKHTIPVCWRCKTPVEFIHATEYFLKQVEYKSELRKIIDMMGFYPEFHKRKLLDWLDSVTQDWPISRDRYYATEVPVWKCKRCGHIILPEPGRYYRPWKEEPPVDKCPNCGASKEHIAGETKVFDTWFDSSISVLYVTGYMRKPELFKRAFNNTLRPQGQDIIRTWLYYTLLRVYQLTGKPAFKWVRITGMGLDEKGEAMHKSKGNVIDPEPYIEKYGADAFRFWAAAAAKLGYDYRFSEQLLRTGMLFETKLWNIARFISSFPEPEPDSIEMRAIDKALLGLLNRVLRECIEGYEDLDTYIPINSIYKFTWDVFASNYIELVKSRAYNDAGEYSEKEQRAAWYVLHTVLKTILKLLAPIMPFITDAIWRDMYDGTVHKQLIPDAIEGADEALADKMQKLMHANSIIWTYKKKKGVKFSEPLEEEVLVSKDLEKFIKELVDLHKLKSTRIVEDLEAPVVIKEK